MSNRFHVNLKQGLIEAEGDKEFVQKVFDFFASDLREQLRDPSEFQSNSEPENPTPKAEQKPRKNPAKKPAAGSSGEKKKPAKGTSKGKGKGTPPINKDLNTKGIDEFVAKYKPANNSERHAVFVHFLESEHGQEGVSPSDLITCFKDATGISIPTAFAQSLVDAQGRYGYLDADESGNYSLSIRGVNRLEAMLAEVAKGDNE